MSAEAFPITPERFAAALKDMSAGSLHLKVLELRNSIAHLDYSNEQLRPFAEGRPMPATPTTASLSTQQQDGATASSPAEGGRAGAAGSAGSEPQPRPEEASSCEPDPVCAEAVRENELVIDRMQERIRLVRAEVEARGIAWTDFQSKEEEEAEAARQAALGTGGGGGGPALDDHSSSSSSFPPGAVTRTTNRLVNGTHSGGGGGSHGREQDAQGAAQHSAWTDGTFQTGVIRPGPGGELRMDMNGTGTGGARGPGAGGSSGGGGTLTDAELRRRMEERLRNLGIGEEEDEEEGGVHL